MKSVQEIIEEVNELKASFGRDPGHPMHTFMQLADRLIDLANAVKTIQENLPHKASNEEINDILKG
jgi:hypothetical protein